MLTVADLCFDYGDEPILSRVSFTVSPGQLLHLQGANGAGKTTLMKLLAGIFQAEHGQIVFDGRPIAHDVARYQQLLRYVGHKPGINMLLTPREQSQFALHREANRPVEPLFERFGLAAFADVPCVQLSAGLRRRVALLRLLLSAAPLWLLDEPFVALDVAMTETLMSCFDEQLARGGMVVLTSHQALPGTVRDLVEYSL